MLRVTETQNGPLDPCLKKNIRAYPLLLRVLGFLDFTEGDILVAAEMVGASFPVLPSSSSIDSTHIREGVGGPMELLRVRSDGHVSSIRRSLTSATSEPGHFRATTLREYVRIPPP
jgi:hypothetical protein